MRTLTGRTITQFVSIAALAAIAACSGTTSPTTASLSQAAGTYTLRSVSGVALPAPAIGDKGVIGGTATSGTVTITAAGTFTSAFNYNLTAGGTLTNASTGVVSVDGNNLSFKGSTDTSPTDIPFTGGNTLTVTMNTQIYVLTK